MGGILTIWMFRFFVIVVFLSYLRTSWSRRDVDALRWRCGSVTWCRPSVPPSALTHHLVANKQTLQRRQHFYNTTTVTLVQLVVWATLQRFATSATTPLHHTGWLNCHIWVVRRSETCPTRSSAKWQINNAADPSSQLGQQLFLSFIQEQGKLTSLAAINQSCCFSFAFWWGFHAIIQWIGENWTNISKETNKMLKLKPMTKASRN